MPDQSRTVIRFAACLLVAAGSAVLSGCAASHHNSSQTASLGSFDDDPANIVSFKVNGMACRNCANEIARELMEVPGVKAAAIHFDSATARVALDPHSDKPAMMQSLHAAVEHWRQEHFAVKEDPNCLDPERREQLQSGGQ
jgi:copper chaperone CopZ